MNFRMVLSGFLLRKSLFHKQVGMFGELVRPPHNPTTERNHSDSCFRLLLIQVLTINVLFVVKDLPRAPGDPLGFLKPQRKISKPWIKI